MDDDEHKREQDRLRSRRKAAKSRPKSQTRQEREKQKKNHQRKERSEKKKAKTEHEMQQTAIAMDASRGIEHTLLVFEEEIQMDNQIYSRHDRAITKGVEEHILEDEGVTRRLMCLVRRATGGLLSRAAT